DPLVRVDQRAAEDGEVKRLRLAHAASGGWVAYQCRAMSIRRATHTSGPASATRSRNRHRSAARPGRPTMRVCRPMLIIFGCVSPSRSSSEYARSRYAEKLSDWNPQLFRYRPSLLSSVYGTTRCWWPLTSTQ